ncbi:MAG: hypothetical protein RLY86_523 [Pseudomonadota bacterium]|jgi:hypothetical protein
MRRAILPGVLVLAGLVAGCGHPAVDGRYLYGGTSRAALVPEVVGRPADAVIREAARSPSQRTVSPTGEEMVVWLHADVHRGEGMAVWCRETVIVRAGMVADYQREGGAC